ncbi:hypothetical protein [Reichenbachiella sp.]|uniref:hypothetical protein n=1 Tax=Reichenbachiella sp. TaxID=2184521 RepID=UPI003BB02802
MSFKSIKLVLLLLPVYCFGQEGKPISRKVFINYAVNQLTNVDYINQNFELDFYLQQYWKIDSTDLSHQEIPGDSSENLAKIDSEHLNWVPKNDFTNAISIESIGDINYSFEHGYVLQDARYKGTFYNPMDMEQFPFDSQDLIIHLEDFSKTSEELEYLYGSPFEYYKIASDTFLIPGGAAYEMGLDFSEFHLNPTAKAVFNKHLYKFDNQTYSVSQFIMNISRKRGFYFTKILFISLLIVLMSWIVFCMDPLDLHNRVSFSITAFLALTAHNFVINDLLPKISYLTTMDYIVLGTNLMVFFTVIESVVVAKVAFRKSEKAANEIDRFCFLGCLAFFLSLCLFVYIKSLINAPVQ